MIITGSESEDESRVFEIFFQRLGTNTDLPPLSVKIPGPYPMTPPDADQLPDFWYVVDHGTQVGIFANRYALPLSS